MDQPRNDSPASPAPAPAARSPVACALGLGEPFGTGPCGFDDPTEPAPASPEGFLILLEAVALACAPGSATPESTEINGDAG